MDKWVDMQKLAIAPTLSKETHAQRAASERALHARLVAKGVISGPPNQPQFFQFARWSLHEYRHFRVVKQDNE